VRPSSRAATEAVVPAGCSAEEFLAAAKDASGIAEMYTKWFLSLSSYEMFVECMMDEEKRQRGMVDGS
jgi:hypothetical protein